MCTIRMRSLLLLLSLTQEELADIGSLYKVQVTGPHRELRQPWHLSLLRMRHTGTKEEMCLAFDCWFNPNEDKCVELPALYADREPLPGKLRFFGGLFGGFFFFYGVGFCCWGQDLSLECEYITFRPKILCEGFPQEIRWLCTCVYQKGKLRKKEIKIIIKIMTDCITADTKHSIWLLSC